jgi:hypothetical protein
MRWPRRFARGWSAESGPLGLGGPLLEVDTTREVNVSAVAGWVEAQRKHG